MIYLYMYIYKYTYIHDGMQFSSVFMYVYREERFVTIGQRQVMGGGTRRQTTFFGGQIHTNNRKSEIDFSKRERTGVGSVAATASAATVVAEAAAAAAAAAAAWVGVLVAVLGKLDVGVVQEKVMPHPQK